MLNVGRIEEGFVLDHIKAGKSMTIYHDLKLDKLDCCSCHHQKRPQQQNGEKKDIIKVECSVDMLDLDILGFIDHNITVNVIQNGKITSKKELHLPSQVVNVIRCKKPSLYHFYRTGTGSGIYPDRSGKRSIPLQIL